MLFRSPYKKNLC